MILLFLQDNLIVGKGTEIIHGLPKIRASPTTQRKMNEDSYGQMGRPVVLKNVNSSVQEKVVSVHMSGVYGGGAATTLSNRMNLKQLVLAVYAIRHAVLARSRAIGSIAEVMYKHPSPFDG